MQCANNKLQLDLAAYSPYFVVGWPCTSNSKLCRMPVHHRGTYLFRDQRKASECVRISVSVTHVQALFASCGRVQACITVKGKTHMHLLGGMHHWNSYFLVKREIKYGFA